MRKRIKYGIWILKWLESKEHYIKESSFRNYMTLTINYIIPVLGDSYICDIDEKKIQEMALHWLTNGRKDKKGGLSEKTTKDILALIKLSLKAASKEKLIDYVNFEIVFPKNQNNKKLQVLSKENQTDLVRELKNNLTPKKLGILFSLYTGIRIGEICALRWQDIDLINKTVTITKTVQRILIQKIDEKSYTKLIITSPKTKTSYRVIPLSENLCIELKKIIPSNLESYLLTNNEKLLEPRTYRNYYSNFIKKIGIEHICFHGLRHTFATRLVENGVDYKIVSELLGHSSIIITLNLYVHPQMDEKRKAVESIK